MKVKFISFSLVAALFASFLLITGCGGGGSKVTSAEEMADKLFEAVSKNDKAAFTGLLVTKDVMKSLLEKAELPEERKTEELGKLDEQFAKFEEEAGKAWDAFMTEVKAAGLEGELKKGEVKKEEEERKGTKGADVAMTVTAGEKSAIIHFTTVESGNWYLLPRLHVETPEPVVEPMPADSTAGDSAAHSHEGHSH